MRILVISLLYAPDGGPSAPLFAMLCENLARRGNEVTVIASVPHYPSGRVEAEYRKGWIQRSRENEVDVIRVRVPSVDRGRLPLRLSQFLAYQIGATVAGLGEQYDAILVSNPALSKGIPFAFLSKLRCKPSVFFVADVYPDVGVQAGIFRHRLVIAVVAAMERFCLNNADLVWVFSESFIPSMRSMGVPDDKLALIYGWVDTDFIRPMPRHNAFSREHGLDDSFVVLYAGNLGLLQGLEEVLEGARVLSDQPEIKFVFVGDGTARQDLMDKAGELGLDNVRFIPFQPRERVPEVLATADVALISLQPGMGVGSIPSKTFSYLTSGRPILAVVDEGSDIWNLVQSSRGGVCIPPGDHLRMIEAICDLKHDASLRKRLGRAGRTWAEEHHSPQQAAVQVEALLRQATARRQQ